MSPKTRWGISCAIDCCSCYLQKTFSIVPRYLNTADIPSPIFLRCYSLFRSRGGVIMFSSTVADASAVMSPTQTFEVRRTTKAIAWRDEENFILLSDWIEQEVEMWRYYWRATVSMEEIDRSGLVLHDNFFPIETSPPFHDSSSVHNSLRERREVLKIWISFFLSSFVVPRIYGVYGITLCQSCKLPILAEPGPAGKRIACYRSVADLQATVLCHARTQLLGLLLLWFY